MLFVAWCVCRIKLRMKLKRVGNFKCSTKIEENGHINKKLILHTHIFERFHGNFGQQNLVIDDAIEHEKNPTHIVPTKSSPTPSLHHHHQASARRPSPERRACRSRRARTCPDSAERGARSSRGRTFRLGWSTWSSQMRTGGYGIFAYWITAWWYTYPSEKYESQLGWLFPIYGKIKHVPNHQPDNITNFLDRYQYP